MNSNINISDYDYVLPEERIAKFPLSDRENSKLLVWKKGEINRSRFKDIAKIIPDGSLMVFNNTKVIRARLLMNKPTGARIEIFCLEPYDPADHERAFSATGSCTWRCIVGNSKKWKEGALKVSFEIGNIEHSLCAYRENADGNESIVRFEWDIHLTFGQLLEIMGRIPIPPYLSRDSEEIDNTRYQTVYSKIEGSVAAPTAGLHFTDDLITELRSVGISTAEVTLHVGAGTFLPVKCEKASDHTMHTEHFDISVSLLRWLIDSTGNVTAVGTTTVRTLESLCALGYRIIKEGDPRCMDTIGQWEPYSIPEQYSDKELLCALVDYMNKHGMEKMKASTKIMIMPGYAFRVVNTIITNFHQPKSTLLLLVSAFVGERWKDIYDYALANDFRFLSYGDSSIIIR